MKRFSLLIIVIFLLFSLMSCKPKNEIHNNSISTYTRDTSSGTRDAFFSVIDLKDAIKDDSVLKKSTLIVDGNGDMITKVINDLNSIGYISLSSYDKSIVKGLTINNIEPTYENVLNNTYILNRSFHFITTKNSTSEADLLALAFNSYLTTKDAKLIIKSKGGIIDLKDSDPKWDDIKIDHPITLMNNSNVTVRFGGSTSVEPIAISLSNDFLIKSGNFKAEHSYTGSSAAFEGTQGKDSSNNSLIHIGFSSRPFNSNEDVDIARSGLLSLDALVAITNTENSISNISISQLKDIYLGVTDSWEEVMISE